MIRNCFGMSLNKIKDNLFSQLDEYLVGFLLSDCPNDQRNGLLQDYDNFSAFTARRSLDYLNNVNANNSSIAGNGDSIFRLLRDITPAIMTEYANRQCENANTALKDFTEQKRIEEQKLRYTDQINVLQEQKVALTQNKSLTPDQKTTAIAVVESQIQVLQDRLAGRSVLGSAGVLTDPTTTLPTTTVSMSSTSSVSTVIPIVDVSVSGSGIRLPNTLSDTTKSALIDQIIADPSLYASIGSNNIILNNVSGIPSTNLVINSSTTSSGTSPNAADINSLQNSLTGLNTNNNTTDDIDSIFVPSIVSMSNPNEIEAIPLNNIIYSKCFAPDFILSNYIVPDDGKNFPILSETKVNNLKKIHDEILIPIFNYYKDSFPTGLKCGMKISGGLSSIIVARTRLLGSVATKHKDGIAVNFSITGLDTGQIIRDIVGKKIDINFGIIAMTNGIYITLPFSYGNYLVERMYVHSPTFSSDNLFIDLL